jgi:hypothetical protein
VFPTRTARFGVALTHDGPLNLRTNVTRLSDDHTHPRAGLKKHSTSFEPIEAGCPCATCTNGTTRAFLHHAITLETAVAHGASQFSRLCRSQLLTVPRSHDNPQHHFSGPRPGWSSGRHRRRHVSSVPAHVLLPLFLLRCIPVVVRGCATQRRRRLARRRGERQGGRRRWGTMGILGCKVIQHCHSVCALLWTRM